MEINFGINYQSEIWGYQVIGHRYSYFYRDRDSLWNKRFCGLNLALNAAMVTVAMRLMKLVEDLFKGLLNVSCCHFSSQYDLNIGAAQLRSFAVSVLKVVVLPFEILISIPLTTFAIMYSPEEYALWCSKSYDQEVDEMMEQENQISIPGYVTQAIVYVKSLLPKVSDPMKTPPATPKPSKYANSSARKNLNTIFDAMDLN
jgi:hypothetical protein